MVTREGSGTVERPLSQCNSCEHYPTFLPITARPRRCAKVCRGYHIIDQKRSIYSTCYIHGSELRIRERSEMAGTSYVHHSTVAVRCDAGHSVISERDTKRVRSTTRFSLARKLAQRT